MSSFGDAKFMAYTDARFITGQGIIVDGGVMSHS